MSESMAFNAAVQFVAAHGPTGAGGFTFRTGVGLENDD